MQISEFSARGLKLISNTIFSDNRGFFTERFRVDRFRELGLPEFVQENFSLSAPGVLRGLHFQNDPAQGKLVTAISGRILDVAVDIRFGSPTFGQTTVVTLDSAKPAWFWIPAGFAHGFLVVGEQPAGVLYKVDSPYNPKGEAGLRWNDPQLGISWPAAVQPILSAKDEALLSWKEYVERPWFHWTEGDK